MHPVEFYNEGICALVKRWEKVGKGGSESGRLHREVTMKCSCYILYFLVMHNLCTFKTQCHEKKPDCITF